MNQVLLETTIDELVKHGLDNYVFIDIREPAECMMCPISEIEHIDLPMSQLSESSFVIEGDKRYVFYCAKGVRSFNVVSFYHAQGKTNTVSLIDGVDAIKNHFQ